LQLREYLNIIRKRWWVAALVVVVAAGVAYGYSITQPKLYETSVKVVGNPAKPDENLNNTIKAEVKRLAAATLTSPDFAARIDQRGRFDLGPDQLLGKIKAQAKPDDYNLIITVDDTSAERAAQIANTAADLIRDDNLDKLANVPDDSKIFFDKTSRAPVPDRPSSPRTNLNTGAGAALGLVLGLILIFVVHFFDTSIRTEDEVERFIGLKVLGLVPSWHYSGQSLPKSSGPIPPATNGRVKNGREAISKEKEMEETRKN
jgi:capsular polysaccharide biosynthesis protein